MLGNYGLSVGAASYADASCAGPCNANPGSYCGLASSSSTGLVCPVGFSCAGGAAQPVPCATPGSWCPLGSSASVACPVGVFAPFGNDTGPDCAGPCTLTPRNYCPAGSSSPFGVICPPRFACATMGAPVLWCVARALRTCTRATPFFCCRGRALC
jgi:hypothetical protein